MTNNKKAMQAGTRTASNHAFTVQNSNPPMVTGQCAEVLSLIRQFQPVLSFVLTADYAIPEAAARINGLRAMGFNIITRIEPEVIFRGVVRRKAAFYSLGVPEWPAPGFFGKQEAAQTVRKELVRNEVRTEGAE